MSPERTQKNVLFFTAEQCELFTGAMNKCSNNYMSVSVSLIASYFCMGGIYSSVKCLLFKPSTIISNGVQCVTNIQYAPGHIIKHLFRFSSITFSASTDINTMDSIDLGNDLFQALVNV